MQGQAQQQHHHQQLQHLQMSQQLQDSPRPGMQLAGLVGSNLRPGESTAMCISPHPVTEESIKSLCLRHEAHVFNTCRFVMLPDGPCPGRQPSELASSNLQPGEF